MSEFALKQDREWVARFGRTEQGQRARRLLAEIDRLQTIVDKLPAKDVLAACTLIEEADQRALAADGLVPATEEMLNRKQIQECLAALWATREAAEAAKAAEQNECPGPENGT